MRNKFKYVEGCKSVCKNGVECEKRARENVGVNCPFFNEMLKYVKRR